jgi:hypothetical protein
MQTPGKEGAISWFAGSSRRRPPVGGQSSGGIPILNSIESLAEHKPFFTPTVSEVLLATFLEALVRGDSWARSTSSNAKSLDFGLPLDLVGTSFFYAAHADAGLGLR